MSEQIPDPLTQDMYLPRGGEATPSARFGLANGQHRISPLVEFAAWYNMFGEPLGRGDLEKLDIVRIAQGLGHTEMFLALRENDAFMLNRSEDGFGADNNTMPWADNTPANPATDLLVIYPDMDFVARNALFAIVKDAVWFQDDLDEYNPDLPLHVKFAVSVNTGVPSEYSEYAKSLSATVVDSEEFADSVMRYARTAHHRG